MKLPNLFTKQIVIVFDQFEWVVEYMNLWPYENGTNTLCTVHLIRVKHVIIG